MSRSNVWEDVFRSWEAPRDICVGAILERAEYNGHPLVVHRILETVEWLSESQVSNYIKGCEVVPGHHINGIRATVDILMQTLHQKINITLDYGFLTAQ